MLRRGKHPVGLRGLLAEVAGLVGQSQDVLKQKARGRAKNSDIHPLKFTMERALPSSFLK